MRLCCTLGLSTLVALESSLFYEFLRLAPECAVMPVGEFAFLRIINRPPLRAGVNTTSDADLFSWLF